MSKVFNKILELSAVKDVTIKDICNETGLSLNYVYGLRNTKSPSIEKVIVLADYFDVSLDYMAGRSRTDLYAKGYRDAVNYMSDRMKYAMKSGREKADKL